MQFTSNLKDKQDYKNKFFLESTAGHFRAKKSFEKDITLKNYRWSSSLSRHIFRTRCRRWEDLGFLSELRRNFLSFCFQIWCGIRQVVVIRTQEICEHRSINVKNRRGIAGMRCQFIQMRETKTWKDTRFELATQLNGQRLCRRKVTVWHGAKNNKYVPQNKNSHNHIYERCNIRIQ